MWYLCYIHRESLDEVRKEAMKIGRENFVSIYKEGRKNYVLLYWRWVKLNKQKEK